MVLYQIDLLIFVSLPGDVKGLEMTTSLDDLDT